MEKKRKFKWCIDWLIIGFILQNFFLWTMVLSNDFELKWKLLLALPFILWGMNLLQENLGNLIKK